MRVQTLLCTTWQVMTQSAAAANDSNDTCQAVPPGVATAAGAGGGISGHPVAQVEVIEDPAAWVAFEGASCCHNA
jgi:hypothetical protein